MGKITSKFQVTVPRPIAKALGLKPGDELDWQAVEGAIRVTPTKSQRRATTPQARGSRLESFDAACARQAARDRRPATPKVKSRGWSREELYTRGSAD